MESFMNGAVMIEAGLLSVLLALWMTWLALSGLFQILPATAGAIGRVINKANKPAR